MKDYKNYGHVVGKQVNKWHKLFFTNYDVKNKTILDIACSAGAFAAAVKDRGGVCIGLDVNPKYKDHFDKLDISFLLGTVEENKQKIIELQPDIITSFELIEHLYDPNTLINECFDILKTINKKGSLFLSTPNAFNIKRCFDFIFKQKHSDPLLDPVLLKGDAEHIRMYSHVMVKKLLENNGFKVGKEDILSGKKLFFYSYFANSILIRGKLPL